MSSLSLQGARHPLAQYKPRAVVDWLVLRFATPSPTQPWHLQPRMPPEWRSFAEAIGDKNSCSEWRLKVQDPPSASTIAHVLRDQGVDPGSVGIEAIEVAIDWCPRTAEARSALASAVHHLFRHLARPPERTGCITEPGHFRAAARPRDTLRALSEGFSVNQRGDIDANHRARFRMLRRETVLPATDHQTRFYVKRHDSGKAGAYHPLPEAQHRARMEVTLSRGALPIKTLADLSSFRFETLAVHLRQRKTIAPQTQDGALIQQERPTFGCVDDPQKRASHRRQSGRVTEADNTANEWVYNALRGLTRRSKNAEIPAFLPPWAMVTAEGERAQPVHSPKYLNKNKKI